MNSNTSMQELLELTFRLGRQMRRKMLCVSKNVNMVQVHALAIIAEAEGMTMKQLADKLMITSPSATSFVQRLVTTGWVERYSDPKNRKQVHLRLTKSGKSVLSQKMQERDEAAKLLLSRLPQSDQRDLLRILRRLVESLEG